MIITDEQLKQLLDDILRDVVCDCGNYRQHGVNWMPEGSGEGLSVAVNKLRKFISLKGGDEKEDNSIQA